MKKGWREPRERQVTSSLSSFSDFSATWNASRSASPMASPSPSAAPWLLPRILLSAVLARSSAAPPHPARCLAAVATRATRGAGQGPSEAQWAAALHTGRRARQMGASLSGSPDEGMGCGGQGGAGREGLGRGGGGREEEGRKERKQERGGREWVRKDRGRRETDEGCGHGRRRRQLGRAERIAAHVLAGVVRECVCGRFEGPCQLVVQLPDQRGEGVAPGQWAAGACQHDGEVAEDNGSLRMMDVDGWIN